jgi:hypothetical protein
MTGGGYWGGRSGFTIDFIGFVAGSSPAAPAIILCVVGSATVNATDTDLAVFSCVAM